MFNYPTFHKLNLAPISGSSVMQICYCFCLVPDSTVD